MKYAKTASAAEVAGMLLMKHDITIQGSKHKSSVVLIQIVLELTALYVRSSEKAHQVLRGVRRDLQLDWFILTACLTWQQPWSLTHSQSLSSSASELSNVSDVFYRVCVLVNDITSFKVHRTSALPFQKFDQIFNISKNHKGPLHFKSSAQLIYFPSFSPPKKRPPHYCKHLVCHLTPHSSVK